MKKLKDRELALEITEETLSEIGGDFYSIDEIALEGNGEEIASLEEFVNIFWDRAVEKILNAVSHS